jgi:hypothetical protein
MHWKRFLPRLPARPSLLPAWRWPRLPAFIPHGIARLNPLAGRPRLRRLALIGGAALFAGVLMAGGFFLLLRARQKPAETPPSPAFATLALSSPVRIAAGAPLTLTITTTPRLPGAPIYVTAHGTFGVTGYRSAGDAGTATWVLDADFTRSAGLVTFRATAGTLHATSESRISAGEPADPLLPLVGPRNIAADGVAEAMAVVLPADQYGNPAEPGTPVTFRVRMPGSANAAEDSVDTYAALSDGIVAYSRIHSRLRAGTLAVSATAGNAYSPERSIEAVPGLPAKLEVVVRTAEGVADGRTLFDVQTNQLLDANGNIILDGTLVQFIVLSKDGAKRILSSQTIAGRANLAIQAPLAPMTMTVAAVLAGVQSPPVTIEFLRPNRTQQLPVAISETDGVFEIRVGPVLGDVQQYIPDGTPALLRVRVLGQAEVRRSGETRFGYATFTFVAEELAPATYAVVASIAGSSGYGTLTVAERQDE